MHIVLLRPEIPPNAGAIIRLCANTGADLHLVEPLGFSLENRMFRRAGLDYHELASVQVEPDLATAVAPLPGRRFAFTSSGATRYSDVEFRHDDVLLFGPESTGLSVPELEPFDEDHRLVIPMKPGNRSLNLANAVSIVLYEALRQQGFPGFVVGRV